MRIIPSAKIEKFDFAYTENGVGVINVPMNIYIQRTSDSKWWDEATQDWVVSVTAIAMRQPSTTNLKGLYVYPGSDQLGVAVAKMSVGDRYDVRYYSNDATYPVDSSESVAVENLDIRNATGSVGSVTGAVGSVSGNVGGNVAGSVASVSGNVGGNVVGTVASVVGNVGGNVTGTVASVVGNVGGNVVGTVASVVGNVGGSVASVAGNIGGNVAGSIGSLAAQAKTDVWSNATRTLTSISDSAGTTTLLSRIGSSITIAGGKVAATVAAGDGSDAASIKSTIGVAGAGLTAIGDTRIANLDTTVSSRAASSGTKGTDNIYDNSVTIKNKTDNLPSSPAATGAEMTLTSAYNAAKTAASQTSVDGKPTLAQIESSSVLAKAAAVAEIKAIGELLKKYEKNARFIESDDGVTYLVIYDDDNITPLLKNPLKTYNGNDVGSLSGTTTPSRRLKSIV